MTDHETDPSPEDLYGKDILSYEQAAGELERAEPVGETANAPSEVRPAESDKTEQHQPPESSPLLAALQGRDINDILPQLSEDERNLLAVRFDLNTGKKLISQRKAADLLGMERKGFRRREDELLDQIRYLADRDLPDVNNG